MPFPPIDKTMEGMLRDTGVRLTLVERRLAVGGDGGGEPATIHPVGDVWQVPSGTAPPDTLLCDGRAVSRTTYADLFLRIGTKYGAGDGSTTFNLPNLNGKRLVITTPQSTISMDSVFASLPSVYPDSYEVRMNIHVPTYVNMRMRAGGVDKTDASYDFLRWSTIAAATPVSGGYQGATTAFYLMPTNHAGWVQVNMTVERAGSSDRTEVLWTTQGRQDTSVPYSLTHGRGTYFPGTIVDGFTLIPDSGTIYGSIDVIPFGGSTVPSVIAVKEITSGVVGAGTTDGGGPAGAALPAGAVVAWDSNTIPTGFLLCDGAVISRAAYPALFAAIGTTHGAGDGATTFQLPNYKGRSLFGRDAAQAEFDVLGETGGDKTHTHGASHHHTLSANGWARIASDVSYLWIDGVTTPLFTADRRQTGAGTGVTQTGIGSGAALGGTTDTATPTTDASSSLPPYGVANWIISTGAGSNPVTPVVPVPLWQHFPLASTGSLRPLNSGAIVWDGTVTGNLGIVLDAAKRTMTIPEPGTYRFVQHIGIATSAGGAANMNAIVNGVQYNPSLIYGTAGPAGAFNVEAEFYLTTTAPNATVVFVANAPAGGVYEWSWLRVEKSEPFYARDALTIQQGSTALRDSIYGIPTTDAQKASLANRMISWFNTDKGYFEIYYATTGTVGLAARGLAAGFPAGWYPAAGSNIWGTCTSLTDASVAAGEVRINLQTGDLVGGITTGNNVMIIPVGGIWEIVCHLYQWTMQGTYRGVQAFDVTAGTIHFSGTTSSNWDIVGVPRRSRIAAGAQIGVKTSGDAAQTIRGQSWPAIEIKYIGPPLVNG